MGKVMLILTFVKCIIMTRHASKPLIQSLKLSDLAVKELMESLSSPVINSLLTPA